MSVFMQNALAGKVALVAGGTSGINLEIAEVFAEYGASVAVISRTPEKVSLAVQSLEKHGGGRRAVGYTADVRDYAAVEGVIAQAATALGALDIVVSGAAGNFLCAAADLSPNGFKSVVDIDLIGTFHVLRAAYAHLKKPGASIINISAPQSTEPYYGQSHASAAKAGVDMLTKSLAVEWGREGVRVNAIVPGPIGDTEGMRRLAPSEAAALERQAGIPLGRYGTKREVAHSALFLASDAASYVSGAILYCDGGMVQGHGLMWESRTKAAAAMRTK